MGLNVQTGVRVEISEEGCTRVLTFKRGVRVEISGEGCTTGLNVQTGTTGLNVQTGVRTFKRGLVV